VKKIIVFLLYGLMTVLLGCASAKKAELAAGDDPQKAVAEVAEIMKIAEEEQTDLLAHDQYQDGKFNVEKARNALTSGYKPQSILDYAAIAKAHFKDARQAALPRTSYSDRILAARKSALDAGLRSSKSLIEGLEAVDDDLRDESDMFTSPLTPEEFSKFQKKYLALEIKAVQYRELNEVENRINKDTRQKAEDLAPKTLNTSLLDIEDARNIIEQSPRNPDIYRDGVKKSIDSSVLLADTMEVILNAKGTPEHIALQIVYQNRKLSSLSHKAGQLENNLKSTQSSLMEKESALQEREAMLQEKDQTLLQQEAELLAKNTALMDKESALRLQGEQLQRASTQVRFQKAMDDAREQLPESDALVYQQGTNLVFRLKRINFRSGTAVIPDASKPLLMKVNEIIKELDAANVVVQGHTDSVGSDELNQDLSTRRATSVANYLASLAGGYPIKYIGYGETRPIASNETAEGRAVNRRVDLVVTAKK
jgi:outer membrane protein OmpA-like peptidoglycan-associated protein